MSEGTVELQEAPTFTGATFIYPIDPYRGFVERTPWSESGKRIIERE